MNQSVLRLWLPFMLRILQSQQHGGSYPLVKDGSKSKVMHMSSINFAFFDIVCSSNIKNSFR